MWQGEGAGLVVAQESQRHEESEGDCFASIHEPELLILFYSRGHRFIGGIGLLSGGACAQQLSTIKFPPNAS